MMSKACKSNLYIFLIINKMDLIEKTRTHSPFTAIVSGPTGSGKTQFSKRWLCNFQHVIEFKDDEGVKAAPPAVLKVLWCYGIWQKGYEKPYPPRVSCTYFDGLPSLEEILEDKPHILVIDDLMSQVIGDVTLSDLFTKVSHHNNLSVLFLTQNLFPEGKYSRTINRNTQHFFLMRNPRDTRQVMNLASQMFAGDTDFFMACYRDAMLERFNYLAIDCSPECDDDFRIRNRLTREEVAHLGFEYKPRIYMRNEHYEK
jgi:hypothetical protein